MLDCRVLRQFGVAAVLFLHLGGSGAAQDVYDVKPGDIPGKPGTIIRSWPLEGGGPPGSEAIGIVYRSTSPAGTPIAVSGSIFFPSDAPPADGRNVIGLAHTTSGVASSCAPSSMSSNRMSVWGLTGLMPGTEVTWGLADMLAEGYVVVATDYPGLGTPGIHPYLIGDSEARSVLDSVRAARNLPTTGATNRFAAWGHSQGGHASLFAGQIAARYAPELELVGVGAASPPTYLIELFDADKTSVSGKVLTAMALYSWSRLFNHPVANIIEPDALSIYEKMVRGCLRSVPEFASMFLEELPLQQKRLLKINPTNVEPWRSIMLRNTPGQAPAGAPVFIAQGSADKIVRPTVTKSFVAALCAKGALVKFHQMANVGHLYSGRDSVGAALEWMAERFRGTPAPSDCDG